jgi:hypothetical protein
MTHARKHEASLFLVAAEPSVIYSARSLENVRVERAVRSQQLARAMYQQDVVLVLLSA